MTADRGILYGALFANAFAATLLEVCLLKQIGFLIPSWSVVLTVVFLSFMIGTGIGSLWAWFRPEMRPHLYWWPFVQGLGTMIAFVALLRFDALYRTLPNLFVLGILFSSPFVCFGYLLAVFLQWAKRAHAHAVGIMYASDLIGASLGITLGTFLFIPLFGVNRAMLLTCAGFSVSAGLLAFPRKGGLLASGLVLAALSGLFMLDIDPFVEQYRQLLGSSGSGGIKALQHRIVYTGWSPLERIDVIDEEQRNLLSIAYNGQIWTAVPKIAEYDPDRVARFVGSYPYAERPRKVLILGSGAGLDVLYAKMAHLHAKQRGLEVATDITAVEIDPLVIHLMANEFSEYNHGIYNDPLVTTQVTEARYFMRNTDKLYDLIYYANVGTPLLVAGTFFGSELKIENYLYTVEGLRQAFERLSSEGRIVIQAAVLGSPDPARLREDPVGSGLGGFDQFRRLLAIVRTVLQQQGIAEWDQHVRLILYGAQLHGQLITVGLFEVGTRPLLPVASTLPYIADYHMEHYQDDESALGQLRQQFPVLAVPRHAIVEGAQMGDVVTDDQPFFYNYPLRQVPRLMRSILTQSLLLLVICFAGSIALSRVRHREVGTASACALWSYFVSVGVSYMMAEVLYANAASVFLNHAFAGPAVLIFGFLLFGGLGSLFSGRMRAGGILPVCLTLAAYNCFLAASVRSLGAGLTGFSLAVKTVAFLGLLLPLAFLIGMFFPLGIQVVRKRNWEIGVGWIYGMDLLASIVGLLAGIAFPFKFGYSISLYLLSILFVGQGILLSSLWKKTPGQIASLRLQ